MKRYAFVIVGIAIAVVLIAFYAVHFYNTSLSDNTSDWGAWGSYVGIGVSILSVSLIYITYKEHINVENLELEDYSSEEFQDTYKRLFNYKTKQE